MCDLCTSSQVADTELTQVRVRGGTTWVWFSLCARCLSLARRGYAF